MDYRGLSRSVVATALAALLTLACSWQPAAASDAGLMLPGDPAIASLLAVEQTMLDLTNADRASNGLLPLDFDPDTLPIARQRATSQLGTASLSHYDVNGDLVFVQLLGDAKLGYQLAGENLARATTDDASVPLRVEQALMKSPTHRKNILERTFTRVSIGAASDGHGQITFAEVYRN